MLNKYYLLFILFNHFLEIPPTCPGHVGICNGPCLYLKPKPTPVRKTELSTQKLLGIEVLWWGYSQASHLSCSLNVPICPSWAFVFLSVTAAFQRPGTAEIKPRQGPGEQTGPGSRPGVMKWKMFTPQAALQCTCTNRMRPAPAPSQGPNYLKTSLYGFALSSPQSTALDLQWR